MEDINVLSNPRDARALLYHARRVSSGICDNGTGRDVEELIVDLGLGIDWMSGPTEEDLLRCELTNQLTPEKILLLLNSLCTWKKIQICHLWHFPRVKPETSNLLSASFSNLKNLTHLDLYGVSERREAQFCLASHARQLGGSLKNLPLNFLRIWSVLGECAVAIRPVVESNNCLLRFLAYKDKYIPGDNINETWCASIEESTAVVLACQSIPTLKELGIGKFRDVDTMWNYNLQEVQTLGQHEPRTDFFIQTGHLLKSKMSTLQKLNLEVESRVSLMGLISGLRGNSSLKELQVRDKRQRLLTCMGKST